MIGTEIIPFGPFEAEKIGFKVGNMKLGNLGYWIFQNREGHFKPIFGSDRSSVNANLCSFVRLLVRSCQTCLE